MLSDAAIRELKASLSGELLVPGDEGYDAARCVFNRMIDRRAALIACCATDDDVVRAKFERLAVLKSRFDPDNVFRMNQNVAPAGAV